MGNPGLGNKFVSSNLNKSYGQQHQFHHHNHNNQHHSSSYGLSSRARPGGGGVGGGMVVLSRPRSSQKASGPKLSVPPPLNLPSLRKEHEKLDSLGSGSGTAGGGIGSGPRPSSSGMGWTKPAAIAMQEKEGDHTDNDTRDCVVDQALPGVINGVVSKGSSTGSVYTPPSARSVVPAVSVPSAGYPAPEKATVLRGEDFPLLKATLPATSGPEKKQKDGLDQKQQQFLGDELTNEHRNSSHLGSSDNMRSLSQSRNNFVNGLQESTTETRSLGGSIMYEKDQKQEDRFLGPLSLLRFNPRSDWADDERDTRHGLTDRGRDHGFSKSEIYWDADFDFPRPSVLPQKPGHNLFDRRWQRDNETGKLPSSEVMKVGTHGRDVRMSGREEQEGNSWRASSVFPTGGFGAQEAGNGRNGMCTRASLNREATKDSKHISSPFRENLQEDAGKRDVGYRQGGRQPWNNKMDSFGSRVSDGNTRDRYGSEQYIRNRGDAYQNNSVSKSSFSLGAKGLPINDPILNFGRDKRAFSRSEKPYLDDPFGKDFGATPFDGSDPFSGGFTALAKKKKDILKQTVFHDPVRESFEAELEMVQKMQEQERLRASEEHDRAMELARREEEDRMRLAREQEERQRRLEEERLETMQRAEQERLESMRRAEEQRIAREEEKHRILMEEERRKQAAKQMLLELEERIAKRHAEASKSDEKALGMVSEKDILKMPDVGDWEDSERMVERITISASSDSSGMNRPSEIGSRPHFPRDGPAFSEHGKAVNSWKRDVLENGNNSTFFPHDLDNGHRSPMRDASIGGTFSRKQFYEGPGFTPSRTYQRGGISDTHMDEINQVKGHRWNISRDVDHYGRSAEMESEFHDNLNSRFGDTGWMHGRSHGNPFPPAYHERAYQSTERDGIYCFGRLRYSMRQPHVLPPPSMNAMLRNPYRPENDRPGPSTFPESELQYNHSARNESSMQTRYDSRNQGAVRLAERTDTQHEHAEDEARVMDKSQARCDSQSSLSVSSAPDSPVHLSNDDLDESGDSLAFSGSESKDITLLEQQDESATIHVGADRVNRVGHSSVISTGDDDEWTVENDQQLQEQEEYDEDEDGYEEEDEVHDGEGENVNLMQNFDNMHIQGKGPSDMENLVLGFNEGVEVGMPNDEFERCLRNEETKIGIQPVHVEEQGSHDEMLSNGQTHQSADDSSRLDVDNSSRIFQDAEKALQDLEIEPKHVPQNSVASEHRDYVDAPDSSGLPTQTLGPSSPTQNVISNVSSAIVQPEFPVKLQFGLFSGPSLIPSPVPAIQIGSIQMPLHLHAPVGPSLTHMHPSQPLFQFGQLRYTSPISQGVLPLGPQSVSYVQPNVPTSFPLNQNVGGPLDGQSGEDSSRNLMKGDVLPVSTDDQSGLLPANLTVSHGLISKEGYSVPARENAEMAVKMQHCQGEASHISDGNSRPEAVTRTEDLFGKKLQVSMSESQSQAWAMSSQSASKEKVTGASKSRGLVSGGRGRRYIFAVKNSGSKSSMPTSEYSRQGFTGSQRLRRQRIEFRVRESSDRRDPSVDVSSSINGMDDKSNYGGRSVGSKTSSRRVVVPNRQPKQISQSDGSNLRPVDSQDVESGNRAEKGAGKESFRKNQSVSHAGEDVDAPLQSGIVRIFEQPGIEAPSDDDDFIEVRSKRQMLNDRREQREKEIKAKSRASKIPRKTRSTSQNNTPSTILSKNSLSVGAEAPNSIRTDFVGTDGHGLAMTEVSAGLNANIVSQPLPPIGTPALKNDTLTDMNSQTIKSFQTGHLPAVSGNGKSLSTGLMFESKNKVLDNPQASLGTWGNSRINQQVMALTQTRLDEAMKPAQFDSHSSVGDPSISVSESSLLTSSILSKDKSFSSVASPINSLLAGEKIQFGAVTSPTILPPSGRAVLHGIGPPGPCRSEVQISHNLSPADNECPIFFEKEKCNNKSCPHLVDCEAEAEAEAAASAIAVAAISSDEIVGSELHTGPVSASDSKEFSGADDGLTTGVSGDSQLSSQSRVEESLSVALPADLSVETPPISLWPPLPSPQSSSSPVLSHVPGGTHSHFPFYEMNPMLGRPIFAFGPHDESASTQSQPQKTNTSVSGPLGTWQHHSGVDSFYGSPAGFSGPFISPSGSIPGVQGPPHMVVYNHFAPVGQFGQVGLSFMGTTYIPSGKQPDWKHNSVNSAVSVSEGDMNSLNVVSPHCNPPNIATPMQHLAPGSPLLPMGSPMAMFDVSPFQSTPDVSLQARWSHVPASPLQPVSVSMPLQQQAEGTLSSQFNHGPNIEQQTLPNRFPESRTATPSNKSHDFPEATDATATQFPDELGLVESSSSTGASASTKNVVARSTSASTILNASKTDAVQNGIGSNNGGQNTSSTFKTQPSHQKSMSSQHYNNSSGYNYQRGGASHKNSSGSEWSHRRLGYQGRNQSLGAEKSFAPSKLKQIYVAKQTTSGTPQRHPEESRN